jgi:hypothetical protein|tara:strand:+ start:2199 stop:2744 length:546 start_codon:yes stop_codon:yes gene_type:complete
MVDPITIAAGFAVARQSIKLCKKALESANDIGQISKHIDTLFHSLEKKPDAPSKKQKKAFSKLRQSFTRETHEEVEDDTSLGAVAADVLEHKKTMRAIENLGIRIDNKFGEGTWKQILEERQHRIEEQEEKIKQKKEDEKLDSIYKEEDTPLAQKILVEGGKLLVILGALGAMAYFFMNYT